MGFKDEIDVKKSVTMDQILTALSKEDRRDLEEILRDPLYLGTEIAKVLRRRGFFISDRAVQRFRKEFNES